MRCGPLFAHTFRSPPSTTETTMEENYSQLASLANQQIPHDQFATPEQESAGGKRKAEDVGQSQTPQQRAKRNRYISIACNVSCYTVYRVIDEVAENAVCNRSANAAKSSATARRLANDAAT